MAAEALTRGLSAELAPQGIRVVGLRPQGIPETDRIRDGFASYAEASGMTWEQFHDALASRTHTPALDTGGGRQRSGLRLLRRGERLDGNDREPGDGQPG